MSERIIELCIGLGVVFWAAMLLLTWSLCRISALSDRDVPKPKETDDATNE